MKDGRRNLGYELVGTSSDGLVREERHPSLPITVKVVASRGVAAHIQARGHFRGVYPYGVIMRALWFYCFTGASNARERNHGHLTPRN